MRYLHSIFLLLFLMACETPESTEHGNTIKLKASGLIASVVISDTISKQTYEITRDGVYYLNLPTTQGIYDLEILNSHQQTCSINDELDLICEETACTADYRPVCGKKPSAGIVCITSPCPTDIYLTYGNQCSSRPDNAYLVMDSVCGGLDGLLTFHQRPVVIANFALLDIFSDDFRVLESSIEENVASVLFEFSGGCGSHNFTFFADEVFMESNPVQLSYLFAHTANDACESITTLEKDFDLLPIKEIFLRNYPESTGLQTVILEGIGPYTFNAN